MAIIADAVHDLGDSAAIGFAWLAAWYAANKVSKSLTYGYARASLLSAVVNGCILILGSLWVAVESIPRLSQPLTPRLDGMLVLACLGLAVNGYAVWRLRGGKTQNEQMISWHLLEDVLGWAGILVGTVLMYFTQWFWIDPLLSCLISLYILWHAAQQLRQALSLFMQAVPSPELHQQIEQILATVPQIESWHHLHLWSLDGERHVMTCHLVLKPEVDMAEQLTVKAALATALAPLALAHTTIELELAAEGCRDE